MHNNKFLRVWMQLLPRDLKKVGEEISVIKISRDAPRLPLILCEGAGRGQRLLPEETEGSGEGFWQQQQLSRHLVAPALRMLQPAKSSSPSPVPGTPSARDPTPGYKAGRGFFNKKIKPGVLKELMPESHTGNGTRAPGLHSRCILANRKN